MRGAFLRLIVFACMVASSTAVVGPAASADVSARETLQSERPKITAADAIRLLNVQRQANGIPPILTEDTELSQGCWNHTNLYRERPGQYPHDELPGQPGYTPLGDDAASSSELGSARGDWGKTVNPWSTGPLHLYGLYNPWVTTAWYGESRGERTGSQNTCMGTAGPYRPSPAAFTVYSYPGNHTSGAAPNQRASEWPFTPGEAVGIPDGTVTGPYVLLYPGGAGLHGELTSAALTDRGGAPVAIKLARPDTPAPPGRARQIVGSGPYVIPVKPLEPLTPYTLTTHWQLSATETGADAGTHTHTIVFTTGRRIPEPYCAPDVCLRGTLALRTSGRKLKITASPAVDQRVHVRIMRGKRMCTRAADSRCPKRLRWFAGYLDTTRKLRLRRQNLTVKLPPKVPGLNALRVSVDIDGPFTARGRKWSAADIAATDYNPY